MNEQIAQIRARERDQLRRLGSRFAAALIVLFVSFSATVLILLVVFGIDRLIGHAYYLLDTGLLIFAVLVMVMVGATWAALISDRVADRVWSIVDQHRYPVSILGGTGIVLYTTMIICLVIYGPTVGAR